MRNQVPELFAPSILRARAQRLSKETGAHFVSNHDVGRSIDIKTEARVHLMKPFIYLLKECVPTTTQRRRWPDALFHPDPLRYCSRRTSRSFMRSFRSSSLLVSTWIRIIRLALTLSASSPDHLPVGPPLAAGRGWTAFRCFNYRLLLRCGKLNNLFDLF